MIKDTGEIRVLGSDKSNVELDIQQPFSRTASDEGLVIYYKFDHDLANAPNPGVNMLID